jgi:hypothetical protein
MAEKRKSVMASMVSNLAIVKKEVAAAGAGGLSTDLEFKRLISNCSKLQKRGVYPGCGRGRLECGALGAAERFYGILSIMFKTCQKAGDY